MSSTPTMPWIAGASTWITGQPASASSLSSAFMSGDFLVDAFNREERGLPPIPKARCWPERVWLPGLALKSARIVG
jgi:hypothetical protein